DDHGADVAEVELGLAGGHGPEALERAGALLDGHLEPRRRVVALGHGDVVRRVTAERDPVEAEHDLVVGGPAPADARRAEGQAHARRLPEKRAPRGEPRGVRGAIHVGLLTSYPSR